MEHKKNILIGCTGSVAAVKLPVVLNLLKKRDQSFQVSIIYGSLIFLPIKTSRPNKFFVDKNLFNLCIVIL